jgi:hypothetical protein
MNLRMNVGIAVAAAAVLAVGAVAAVVATGGEPDDSGSSSTTIPQPPLGEQATLPLAVESARVDLVMPSFSHPTQITNPLFPISDIHSSLFLGAIEGKPLRIEITLLPETKFVEWAGRPIEALESQFVAFLDGRIHEVATDLYAQADDGSVWYLGEDVFNYEAGSVADTEGTWLAGRGSPATMIMPADPQVGDVYRAENMPGVVFEQVTVKAIGKPVAGPTGPIEGAMVGEELHMEGDLEDKTFAPGYGEFFSGYQAEQNFEANALTVPADALDEAPPAELQTLGVGADRAFVAARAGDWREARAAERGLNEALVGLRARNLPELLGRQLSDALDALTNHIRGERRRAATAAALAVASAGLDLELRYRQPVEIDLARFELRTRQLSLDAAARDGDAVRGEVTTLQWIRDRLALEGTQARNVDAQLRYLEAAAEAGEFEAIERAAARLRETIRDLEPTA